MTTTIDKNKYKSFSRKVAFSFNSIEKELTKITA